MSEESNNWRDYLTEDEITTLEAHTFQIEALSNGATHWRKERRKLYLRAKKREAREQKPVDQPSSL